MHGAKGSGADAGKPTPSAVPERCPHARAGVAFYRGRYADWRAVRGVSTSYPAGRKPRNCPDAHYLAELWPDRSFEERQTTEKWIEEHTLVDVPFGPGNQAWLEAVEEAQRVFPGTDDWLRSCSDAEGGWGRWVGYSGVSYSTWLRDSNTVGGPLQFRWQTFKGMYRRALDYLKERSFRVPAHLRDPGDDRAWRSALGQALAGAWGILNGQRSHWSASIGNGC